jgi:hypothetical protein
VNPNPLSKVDLAAARTGLYECRLTEQELARCRACGLDVAEMEARCEHLKNFFEAVLTHFPADKATQQPLPS